jgi:hypothetical protein
MNVLTEYGGYGCHLLPAVVLPEGHDLAVLLRDGHRLHVIKVANCLEAPCDTYQSDLTSVDLVPHNAFVQSLACARHLINRVGGGGGGEGWGSVG